MQNKTSYTRNISKMFDSYGMTHETENLDLISKPKITSWMLIFKDKYISHWKNKIKNTCKLSFYSSLKENYQPQSYFDVLQNKEIRKQLTKLRISNHKLMIETGRYQHSKIPADVCFCPVCGTSEIENEEHFIINCKKYKDVREKFLGKIKLVTNSKTILNNNGSLRLLMTSTNPKIVKIFFFSFSVRTNTQCYTY